MATTRKKTEAPAAEVKIADAIKAFNKAHEGKTLTDPQKKHKKDLQDSLAQLKFVRIFNKRFPRVLASIKGIEALGAKSYGTKTPAQVDAIVNALSKAVSEVQLALGGKKSNGGGFVLPGFEDEKK